MTEKVSENKNLSYKKNNFFSSSVSVLPVPVESLTGVAALKENWNSFKGILRNDIIIIEDTIQIYELWNNGCFGHGNISSNGVEFKSTSIKKAQYERRKDWQKLEQGSSSSKMRQEKSEKLSNSVYIENEEGCIETLEDPYHLEGKLHLTLEEGFFLSYALGALVIKRDSSPEMTIDKMWQEFININKKFPFNYCIYHHFRSKGWVVKPGLKFGGDWLLYTKGPEYYHAEYIVWTQCLWKDTLEEDSSLSSRKYSPLNLFALQRLADHVKKKVLLCHVIRPRHLTNSRLQDIACLKDFEIHESIFQRWLPNKEETEVDDT